MIWEMHNLDWNLEEGIDSYKHFETTETREEIIKRIENRNKSWQSIREHCNETNKPLMSVKVYKDIPSSRTFPLDAVAKKFDTYFFTAAITYMLAYAIYTNYTHIDMYGCNVETGTEWAYQRDCISYWIGYARGRGIKVTISGSGLRPLRIHYRLDKKLYSYDIVQPETGTKIMETANYCGKMMNVTVWNEGPRL